MSKRKAMYIIDKDYKIISTNSYFRELFPHVKNGSTCYKAIANVDRPCSACPKFNENNESSLFNLVTGEWVKATSVEIDYKDQTDCNAIIFNVWKEDRTNIDIKGGFIKQTLNDMLKVNPNQGIFACALEEGFPLLYANDYIIDMMGYDNYDEFYSACNGLYINFIHNLYWDDIYNVFDANTYNGMLYNFAYKLRLKNDKYIDVLEKGQALVDDEGKMVIISVITDLSKVVYSETFMKLENKALIEQNQLLTYVNEALPGGYHRCKLDDNFTFIDMSPRFLEMLGFTKEEVINTFHNEFMNLVYEDDVNILNSIKEDLKHTNSVVNLKYRIKHKTKGYIWVKDITKRCEFKGEVFAQCTVLDITDEMNRQFELEQQNNKLKLISENIPCGFKITYDDPKHTFAYVSEECANLFGYTVDEFLEVTGGNSIGFCYEGDVESIFEQLKDSYNKGDTNYRIRFRVKCKDGTFKKVIDCGKTGYTEDGLKIYYSYILDITEGEENKDIINLQNKLLEQEREKIAEKEKSIQQMELIYTLSKDFNTVYYMDLLTGKVNYVYSREPMYTKEEIEAYYRLHSYTEGINKYIDKHVHEEDKTKVMKALSLDGIRKSMKSSNFLVVKYRRIVNNKPVYFETKVAKVGGNLSNYVIIGYKNVDEETKLELQKQEMLEEALDQAQKANKAKTLFLNNMSHDIRTPMNAIIGYSNLATNNIDNKEKIVTYLDKINKASNHLLALINDVLDMSRIESGKIRLENKKEKLSKIIHNMISIVGNDIKAKNLNFYTDAINLLDDDVICDKLRLSQILLNLLSNSIKFTNEYGSIYLTIFEKKSNKPHFMNYEFHVKDTGIGMSKEFIEHIFEPFVRERTSTVSGTVGTGLGMSITKSIVDILEGTIEVKSEINKGSEFIVSIDLEIIDTKYNEGLDYYNNSKCLILDEEEDTCNSIVKMLDKFNIKGKFANSSSAFKDELKKAKDNPYDIYIINSTIKDFNPLDILDNIKSLDYKKLPLIILTKYEWIELDRKLVKDENIHFILKPMFITDLRKVLFKHINKTTESKTKNINNRNINYLNKRILLAEDNEFNQEIASEILKAAGFIVDVSNNGKEAIDKLLFHEPYYYDLILMDIQMPIMDGYEATTYIRSIDNKDYRNIPIIAMTANAFSEDKKKSMEIGMNDYLTKPIEVDKLFNILDIILNNKR